VLSGHQRAPAGTGRHRALIRDQGIWAACDRRE